jgi:outer membrane protein assembly factor BamA
MPAARRRSAATPHQSLHRRTGRATSSAARACSPPPPKSATVNSSIGLAAFVDAGNAFESYQPEFDNSSRRSAGVRYLTPVGPLRVDLAFPLEPDKDDSWVALYVGLGQSF